MKKVDNKELAVMTGGMTCTQLSQVLDTMMYGQNATQQSWDQAMNILDLLHSGYTLCSNE